MSWRDKAKIKNKQNRIKCGHTFCKLGKFLHKCTPAIHIEQLVCKYKLIYEILKKKTAQKRLYQNMKFLYQIRYISRNWCCCCFLLQNVIYLFLLFFLFFFSKIHLVMSSHYINSKGEKETRKLVNII